MWILLKLTVNFAAEKFLIIEGNGKIMEVKVAGILKKCLTGMFDIIKAGFPKAEIIGKYMIISGRFNN